MKKINRIMKPVSVSLTIIQAAIFMMWALYCFGYIAVISSIIIPYGMIKDFVSQLGMLHNMIPSALIVPIFLIVLFQQIKVILKDMLKGVGFKQKHVKRLYVIALILAVNGILGATAYFSPYIVNWVGVFQSVSNGFFMGLIVFAIAKIFAHGVEVQTDSDMTV